MIDRREFISGITLGLLAAPLAAEAQETTGLPRVGHLAIAGPNSTPQPPPENWNAFLAALREGGYEDGKTFTFEHRDARNRPELFRAAAAELVRAKVAVIFARGGHAVRAAKQATNTIPIVAIDLETDPIVAHFVQSLARPGGNVTGMFLDLADLSGKHMELLKELRPKLARLAVLGDPEINAAGRALSVQVEALRIQQADDLPGAFGTAARNKAGALLLLSSPLGLTHRRQIADLAVAHRLPTMFVYRSHVDAGGLMSYGPNLPDMFRHCGVYVARILAGSKPAEMPVERPTVFELVINLKTARALGLPIPPSLLQRADQVIE